MSRLQNLKTRLAEINAINMANALMDWDHQCFMPHGAAEARAQHQGILSRLAHEMFTSDETQRLVQDSVSECANEDDSAMLRVVKREIDQATKIPAELVEKKMRLSALGHETWVRARQTNDFNLFAPVLEDMFGIAREEAGHLGYTDHVYDALTDLYEEGATKAGWDSMFSMIKLPLVELVRRIKESGEQPDDSIFYGQWEDTAQAGFTEMLAKDVGFDFDRGRQDTAAHPFCTNFSVNDVRLTTRFKPYLASAIFGTLHEAGHGMYEQGSPGEWDMSPLAGGVSLGIHESQSRTWENIVGRSRAFWQRYLPKLKAAFPSFPDVPLDQFYKAINKVEPSLIRVEADEVTYNLHIMVRYEVECALLTGAIAVKDLPDFWNSKYEEYLGITPPNDAEGCLQDVHWSAGSIGYFPTYSMGNILSYQLWEKLCKDLGDVDALMSAGNFTPILEWLQSKVYRHGKKYPPAELMTRVTGRALDARPYVDGITKKYEALYSLTAGV
ncbi:MAG: carboxypeptidase M32 [Chthonomonadaceae bacterium]|nr:carboxypeptidase M32 [Chthonomonadaceae bacterium]